MSEEQPSAQPARYVYKYYFAPPSPKRMESGDLSKAELQAYIDGLLGLSKETKEKVNQA